MTQSKLKVLFQFNVIIGKRGVSHSLKVITSNCMNTLEAKKHTLRIDEWMKGPRGKRTQLNPFFPCF